MAVGSIRDFGTAKIDRLHSRRQLLANAAIRALRRNRELVDGRRRDLIFAAEDRRR